MPTIQSDANQLLQDSGALIQLDFERTSATTATITWQIPAAPTIYDGVVILLTPNEEPTLSEYPVDGTRYRASADLSSPVDMIGNAVVVGALYRDKITTSINVIGLTDGDIYFVTAHVVDSTMRYDNEGSQEYSPTVETETFSGQIPQLEYPPQSPVMGTLYYGILDQSLNVFDGTVWFSAKRSRVVSRTTGTNGTTQFTSFGSVVAKDVNLSFDAGTEFPVVGLIDGLLFYHTGIKRLCVWRNNAWIKCVLWQVGQPAYAAIGVGSDGSIDEKVQMANVLKRKLGWPQVCVELNETDFSNAIDEGISMFRRIADNAYEMGLIAYQLKPNQPVYYLNDPSNGTHRVVDIIKVGRGGALGAFGYGTHDVYMQPYFQDMLSNGAADLTSLYAMAEYGEMFERIFAHDIGFQWNEARRELRLHRRIPAPEVVVIECSLERTIQELLKDRYISDWIEDWALAECMWKMGQVRSKFGTIPSATGGTTMNGAELIAQANESFTELRRQVTDYEVGNGTTFGNTSIIIG